MTKTSSYLIILFIIIPIVGETQIVIPTPNCDLNIDGTVNQNDLYLLVQHWQISGNSYTATPTNTSTPTPISTRPGYLPAPTNIRLEGEQVEGAYQDTFYEQVTISWDPIPNFDVHDASNYYMIDIFYIEGYIDNFYYFSKRVGDSTSVILNINDPDFEPLGFSPTGYLFILFGVEVTQSGISFTSLKTQPRYFNLIRRPTPTPTPTAILTPTP